MKEILETINEFFTDLFGDVGKWIMLGAFGIGFILSIVLLILAVVNLKQILLDGILILLIIGLGVHIYKRVTYKG